MFLCLTLGDKDKQTETEFTELCAPLSASSDFSPDGWTFFHLSSSTLS